PGAARPGVRADGGPGGHPGSRAEEGNPGPAHRDRPCSEDASGVRDHRNRILPGAAEEGQGSTIRALMKVVAKPPHPNPLPRWGRGIGSPPPTEGGGWGEGGSSSYSALSASGNVIRTTHSSWLTETTACPLESFRSNRLVSSPQQISTTTGSASEAPSGVIRCAQTLTSRAGPAGSSSTA